MNTLKAANLKLRHTMFNKLLIICPVLTAAFSFLSSGLLIFQSLAVYWWYLFIMQGFIAILCFLSQRADDISGNSLMIYSLPVKLKKVKWANTFVTATKFAGTTVFYMLLVHLIPFFLFPDFASYSFTQLLLATIALVATSLWQIPFCSILMKLPGKFFAIVLNVVTGIVFISFLGKTDFWIAWPHCWCSKTMEQILHIGSNGVLLENIPKFGIVNAAVIALSIILFIALGMIDAVLYERGAKK